MSQPAVVSTNPFEVLECRLSSIEELLNSIINNQPKVITGGNEDDDVVELEEASKILHISPSRLYVIHHKYFNTQKPGKKVLFFKKELKAYLSGTLKEKEKSDKGC